MFFQQFNTFLPYFDERIKIVDERKFPYVRKSLYFCTMKDIKIDPKNIDFQNTCLFSSVNGCKNDKPYVSQKNADNAG